MQPLSSIPWWALTCAYGSARRVPRWIRDLDSADEGTWEEAVNEGLWSSLCHQYTLYSATPYAIPYVAQAAQRAVPECQRQILAFLKACAEQEQQVVLPSPLFSAIRIIKGIRRLTISSALLSCHGTIKRFLSVQDDRTRELAIWLDAYCCAHGGQPTAPPQGRPARQPGSSGVPGAPSPPAS